MFNFLEDDSETVITPEEYAEVDKYLEKLIK